MVLLEGIYVEVGCPILQRLVTLRCEDLVK